jgi:hypothetical protein
MRFERKANGFHGWRVVRAAFVLGAFGWGIGFFGPPVFLGAKLESSGWPLGLISAAVSLHFLLGALTGANLPRLHRRCGAAPTTKAGAASMAAGLVGWAVSAAHWQLFLAAALTGFGWGTMSAAALNLIVTPWFVRARPAALSAAYNGGSVGGIVFSPLWVAAIGALGFVWAACAIGLAMLAIVWTLADRYFVRNPQAMGLRADGDSAHVRSPRDTSPAARPLPGAALWRDRTFALLAAGMTLGLFAQIGLTAHLFSLLVPALGAQAAGWAMALITVMAIAGRGVLAATMRPGTDRSLFACIGYLAQFCGCVAFVIAGGDSVPWLFAGIVLFGIGFGNATSLPPLIAQVEFVESDVQRVTASIVGIAQTGYAFAPAAFGLLRELSRSAGSAAGGAAEVFATAAILQALALGVFLRLRARAIERRMLAQAACGGDVIGCPSSDTHGAA